MSKKVNYFRRLIDDKDPANAIRFLSLAMSAFLIICAFVLLFTRIPNANAPLLEKAMFYATLIVLMGLFKLSVADAAKIMLEVSKTKAAAQILSPTTPVTKVENVEGDMNGPNANKKEEGDDIMEDDEDMIKIKKNLTDSLKTEE